MNEDGTMAKGQDSKKAAKTTADYELMTSLYRKHVGMFKIAIGKGHGQ